MTTALDRLMHKPRLSIAEQLDADIKRDKARLQRRERLQKLRERDYDANGQCINPDSAWCGLYFPTQRRTS